MHTQIIETHNTLGLPSSTIETFVFIFPAVSFSFLLRMYLLYCIPGNLLTSVFDKNKSCFNHM